jgi:hypothetical protein
MPQVSRYLKSVKAITSLKPKESVKSSAGEGTELDPTLVMLRIWQNERLKKTHADFLRSKRYGPACQFFLSDIYAPEDFSQRDNDIEYLYEVMSSVLPTFLLSLVSNTVQLNNLTNNLDHQLLNALVVELGIKDSITPQTYSEAYRICDNYSERVHQIELLMDIGRQVDIGTRIPLVGTTLRLARGPAHRAGWGEVHDFLEKGFSAFKKMRGSKKFLNTVKRREIDILDKIFAGDPNPF